MAAVPWEKPEEYGRRNHSVFLDAELWTEIEDRVSGQPSPQRAWSCSFLASVWQLLRLGLLRSEGKAVARPYVWSEADDWPDDWSDMPTVIQVGPNAAPFAAYRAMSVLPNSYLPTEHAVRIVLNHLQLNATAAGQIADRAKAEGIDLPTSPANRLSHVFLDNA